MGEIIIPNTHEATIQEAPWDLYTQESTQRIKSVRFDRLILPDQIGLRSWEIWEQAKREFDHPLVQVRAIMPMACEEELIHNMDQINGEVQGEDAEAWVPARIPLNDETAIYYTHIASNRRPTFKNDRSIPHEEAIARALAKGPTTIRPLPEGFSLIASEYGRGGARNIFTDEQEVHSMEEMAAKIANLHRRTFRYPHDPAQQSVEGVCKILQDNPVAVVLNPDRDVVSVALWEQDTRLAAGPVLAEQTYFTDLDSKYQRHGFSSHLRQATHRLAIESDRISVYGGQDVIPYVESITGTSFMLSIRNGFRLAGTPGGRITGNLGSAYTAIGDAHPQNGYESMGVTYTDKNYNQL